MPGTLKVFKPGDVVFTEGSQGQTSYYIQKGAVEVSRIAGGKKTVIEKLSAGQSFGEYALLREDNSTRSATVTVLDDTVLVEISKSSLEEILDGVPDFVLSVIKSLVTKLLSAQESHDCLRQQLQEFHLDRLTEILKDKEDSLLQKFPARLEKYSQKERREMVAYLDSLVTACREKYNIPVED